jgi:NAD-dependent deacetylase sirtuin 1
MRFFFSDSLPQKVPQILINREPLMHLNFDIELLGDCDVIISELCRRLAEGFEVLADSSTSLTEITRDQLRTPPIPSPPKYARETSVEDKVNKHSEDCNEAQQMTCDEQRKNDPEKPNISSEVESKIENSGNADSAKPDMSTCKDGQDDMSAISSSKCLESNTNESSSETTTDKVDEAVPCDSTTNDMRAMWQPKKVSLAKYLEGNRVQKVLQFCFLCHLFEKEAYLREEFCIGLSHIFAFE